jgi:hypothetical protein
MCMLVCMCACSHTHTQSHNSTLTHTHTHIDSLQDSLEKPDAPSTYNIFTMWGGTVAPVCVDVDALGRVWVTDADDTSQNTLVTVPCSVVWYSMVWCSVE